MALLDLDDFKAVNDTYGHVAGDALLSELAVAWQSQLRRCDLLARYGGDEFAVIMPDTDRDDAICILERLRTAHRAQWSAGVVSWDDEDDLNQLLQRADDDLYHAKNMRSGPRSAVHAGNSQAFVTGVAGGGRLPDGRDHDVARPSPHT